MRAAGQPPTSDLMLSRSTHLLFSALWPAFTGGYCVVQSSMILVEHGTCWAASRAHEGTQLSGSPFMYFVLPTPRSTKITVLSLLIVSWIFPIIVTKRTWNDWTVIVLLQPAACLKSRKAPIVLTHRTISRKWTIGAKAFVAVFAHFKSPLFIPY